MKFSCPPSFFIVKSESWFVSVKIICGAVPDKETLFTQVKLEVAVICPSTFSKDPL